MFFRKTTQPAEAALAEPHKLEDEGVLASLRRRLKAAGMSEAARKAAAVELERLAKMDASLPEYAIGMGWLEFMAGLPWSKSTVDDLDLARAEAILDARHHGLAQVKERILEHLAAKTLRERRSARVLVVDDEAIARENLAHVFKKDGYAVTAAEDGLEALDRLAEAPADVVVSDLKMSRMDGQELLTAIRARHPQTGVILVTGYATVDSAVKALKSGADHYLSKPVDLDEMRRAVAEVLDKRRTLAPARGSVLCFAGPPGTGKTSIGQAVADALGRVFVRLSLAGMRDEAELRGHRRTYVGAMPGRILKELARAGYRNPVFMLDEVDKIGQDFRGDPASVLLEVLDPEQNAAFVDNYLEVPFDLSGCMFVATANLVDRLPGPLLDRLEVLPFQSYTEREKREITRRFFLPRQFAACGLPPEGLKVTDQALETIIRDYTREAGLRNLEREIARLARRLARLTLSGQAGAVPAHLTPETVAALLGPPRVSREGLQDKSRVGVTTGLVWSEAGGEIVLVETTRMPGTGRLILTGSLGEVLRESAQTALSYVRSHAAALGLPENFFAAADIHVHIPAGAVPKDGPSAGATIALALVSLLTGRPARADTAMSGEMSLSGRILPVSGIREKVLAAARAGLTQVVLPRRNERDVAELTPDALEGLHIVLADEVADVVETVLEPAADKGRPPAGRGVAPAPHKGDDPP